MISNPQFIILIIPFAKSECFKVSIYEYMIIADNVNISLQAKEGAFVEYLKSCEGGKVPAKAPEARVRHREREMLFHLGAGSHCTNF